MDQVTGESGNATTVEREASIVWMVRLGPPIGSVAAEIEPSSGTARTTADSIPRLEESAMKKATAIAGFALALVAAAVAAAFTIGPGAGSASSHREAPLIAEDPSADLTDSTPSAARTSRTPSRCSRT